MHTNFDALSKELAIFYFERMALRIFALHMRISLAFLCDDVITFD